ncbi:MAG: hypothetical protein SFV24_21330 [Gemmatimonadales bacterium]|nr:hypothetical protein [Gemmatimonadales bacterium]
MIEVERDERTISVENGSYRWGYLLLSYGLLLSTAYRGFVREESSWDLLGLVVAGGVLTTVYQGRRQILSRRWAMASAFGLILALGLGVVLTLLRR